MICADVAGRIDDDACRRASGARRATAGRSATASTRSSTSCAASAVGEAAHRRDGRKRAARTGIGSLKIRYNRVFGYYIEVSKSNLGAVPPEYQRKQTIAGGERFITPALKEYQDKVLGADERMLERELELSKRSAARRRQRLPASRTPRARSRRSTRWPRSLRPPPSRTTSSRTCTTATRSSVTDARHPVVERRTAGRVRRQRRAAQWLRRISS